MIDIKLKIDENKEMPLAIIEDNEQGYGICELDPCMNDKIACDYARRIVKRYNSHNELVKALEFVQYALACWRDQEPITHIKHGVMSLEEVKYCIVDVTLDEINGRNDSVEVVKDA